MKPKIDELRHKFEVCLDDDGYASQLILTSYCTLGIGTAKVRAVYELDPEIGKYLLEENIKNLRKFGDI